MPLISGYHQSLERNVKTEIVIDKLNDFQNAFKLKDYFGSERIRSYSPETIYDAYLHNKLRLNATKLFSEITSNTTAKDIISNTHFQNIVNYGEAIVPHILNSLEREPSILVWSLNAILKKKISNNPLSITEASKEWIKWGKINLLG